MKERTRKLKVHLVMADTSYEGSAPVRAFVEKKAAEAFRDRCIAYHSKQPVLDADVADEAWHKAYRKHERWQARHPAGRAFSSFDTFSVCSVGLEQ